MLLLLRHLVPVLLHFKSINLLVFFKNSLTIIVAMDEMKQTNMTPLVCGSTVWCDASHAEY